MGYRIGAERVAELITRIGGAIRLIRHMRVVCAGFSKVTNLQRSQSTRMHGSIGKKIGVIGRLSVFPGALPTRAFFAAPTTKPYGIIRGAAVAFAEAYWPVG